MRTRDGRLRFEIVDASEDLEDIEVWIITGLSAQCASNRGEEVKSKSQVRGFDWSLERDEREVLFKSPQEAAWSLGWTSSWSPDGLCTERGELGPCAPCREDNAPSHLKIAS